MDRHGDTGDSNTKKRQVTPRKSDSQCWNVQGKSPHPYRKPMHPLPGLGPLCSTEETVNLGVQYVGFKTGNVKHEDCTCKMY